MPVETVAAWLIAFLLAGATAYLVATAMRERRKRAAVVGGLLFGGLAATWTAAVLFLPALHLVLTISLLAAAALAVTLLFAPIGGRPVPFVRPPVERYDERLIMFARARYRSGEDRYAAFYGEFPELKQIDDALREMPRLGEPGGVSYDPLNAPLQEALFGWIDSVRETVDGAVADHPMDLTPEDAAARLKGLALALGAVSAGTTAVNPNYVYSRIGRGSGEWGAPLDPDRYPYALVFAVEMQEEMIAAAPLQPAVVDSSRQYVEGAKTALVIANYIRALGYPARAHIDGNYRLILPPLAADAGLGEVGRLTLLITPEYGPRVRLGAVTTTLPLRQDRAIAFGVGDFCNACRKCARNCPPRALPWGGKEELRGTSCWLVDPVSCYRYWLRVGSDCSLCVAVCPYSHPRAPVHSFVRAACRRSSVSRRLFALADDLFYGRTPRSTRYPPWMLAGLGREARERLRLR